MKAIILAAGRGTRMQSLTLNTPKPLLKIKNKPVIEHVIDALPAEVDEIIVVVKYLGDQIRQFLGNQFKGRKVSSAEGSDKGNAYSFLAARPLIKAGERFLFVYGDEFPLKEDFENCLKKELGVAVFESHNPRAHGMVTLGSDGMIEEVVEKPETSESNMAVDGIMVLNSDIFNYEPLPNQKGEYYFTSLLNQFVKDHEVFPVPMKNFIGDVTAPGDLERVEKLIP